MTEKEHEPVMLAEAMERLEVRKGRKYIDATTGAGGHGAEIERRGGEVLGIDADPRMLELARGKLKAAKLVLGNFRNIDEIAKRAGFSRVAGVLFDLGVSRVHFDDRKRGFSFREPEAMLDMRLDPGSQAVTAADLLNKLREDQLEGLLEVAMTASEARRWTKLICDKRKERQFRRVGDILELMREPERGKRHPATKLFMALRIAVNSELPNLRDALPKARELLEPGGRLVVISFHSGEDGTAKEQFRKWEKAELGRAEPEKAEVPGEDEVRRNRLARSAKMRTFIKNEDRKGR